MPEDIETIEDDTNAEDELEQIGPGNGSAENDAEPAHAQISNPSTPSKPGSERAVHAIINLLLVVVIVLVAVLAWKKYTGQDVLAAQPPVESIEVVATLDTSESVDSSLVELAPLELQTISYDGGIARKVQMHSIIPPRPNVEVITYTVQSGDSIFSIADVFGIRPETVLWGNHETLVDNPHFLKTNLDLNILPVDGTYYQWNEGDNIGAVAGYFGVEVEEIVEYPGNRFDLTEVESGNLSIEPGTWLIVPGGHREIVDWGPPAISRDNPASASFYGPGHCGTISSGAVGTGTFVWPTTERFLSGYTYNPPLHPAIDIGGAEGNPIYAVDSGVVVYAGWSNFGYGYLIVIDHGTGWQSAYAHLSGVGVICGQSVFQGATIGALGTTGKSSGPHLHFEMMFYGGKVNPLGVIP
jgi:murein DD-endopeptidase MepM/ murein hydrolase activator NlpD